MLDIFEKVFAFGTPCSVKPSVFVASCPQAPCPAPHCTVHVGRIYEGSSFEPVVLEHAAIRGFRGQAFQTIAEGDTKTSSSGSTCPFPSFAAIIRALGESWLHSQAKGFKWMKGYTWQYRHHAWAIRFFFSKYVFFRMEGCRGKAYPTCLPDPFFHFRPGTWWNSGSCRAPQEKRLCGERWLGTQPCKPWVCNQNPRFRIEPLIFLGYWGLRYIAMIFVFTIEDTRYLSLSHLILVDTLIQWYMVQIMGMGERLSSPKLLQRTTSEDIRSIVGPCWNPGCSLGSFR